MLKNKDREEIEDSFPEWIEKCPICNSSHIETDISNKDQIMLCLNCGRKKSKKEFFKKE